ncbi:uncharacterized protein LOC116261955 isoform X2 [Nymphaea colorata]|uniref:uncharacterized protein LOC116261955 isoform X2 n=1 Tax=Nymphaea colorata TaxID=210225 RepID=UPI00129D78AE|nr:uncharacterized protein LOC116261955 isoform X2 [Nymphaea colorata]
MCASCPVCNLSFPLPELERHVNDHFEDNEISMDSELAWAIELAPSSPLSKGELSLDEGFSGRWLPCAENMSEGQTSKQSEEKVKHLVSLQLRSKFYHVEDGLVTLLRNCLESDTKNLCSIISRHVDHFQSTKSEDSGWGCGWRNIQMMSSHLITERKDAREVLFGGLGFVPDIASLQRWLEIAWERGFDTVGARSFQNRIYGSSKWIGTTECAALFRSFGLRATIVDFECEKVNGCGKKRFMKQVHGPMDKFVTKFHKTTSQTNGSEYAGAEHSESHIRPPYCFQEKDSISDTCESYNSTGDHHALVDWVWNYFASENYCSSGGVSVSKKTPLYFQHDGHSRTIIGIQIHKSVEKMSREYSLLVLDPSQRTVDLESSLKRNVGWQRLLKRGVHTLKKPQYQLCYVDPGIAFGKELEQLKTIDSILVEI